MVINISTVFNSLATVRFLTSVSFDVVPQSSESCEAHWTEIALEISLSFFNKKHQKVFSILLDTAVRHCEFDDV